MSNNHVEESQYNEEHPTHPTNILNRYRSAVPESDPIKDAQKAAKAHVKARLEDLRGGTQAAEKKLSSVEKARLARSKKVED